MRKVLFPGDAPVGDCGIVYNVVPLTCAGTTKGVMAAVGHARSSRQGRYGSFSSKINFKLEEIFLLIQFYFCLVNFRHFRSNIRKAFRRGLNQIQTIKSRWFFQYFYMIFRRELLQLSLRLEIVKEPILLIAHLNILKRSFILIMYIRGHFMM